MTNSSSDHSDVAENPLELVEEYAFTDNHLMVQVLGPSHRNIEVLSQQSGVEIGYRGGTLLLRGAPDAVHATVRMVDQFALLCKNGKALKPKDVARGVQILKSNPNANLDGIFNDVVHVTSSRRLITPKGMAQKRYVDTIRSKDLTFGIGPAGTGKTYLAVAIAVSEFMAGRFKRIILTRPAVEAGENLGFLPGDMVEKINPYVRPLNDALSDMMSSEQAQDLLRMGQIEIAPLAFMRGRTLNDAFVILDEAQNTTRSQMKMFLTRLGYSSKAVVTGDITQVDLPHHQISGLRDAQNILHNIDTIGFCTFSQIDVVRHELVQKIIKAYDAHLGKEHSNQHRRKRDS